MSSQGVTLPSSGDATSRTLPRDRAAPFLKWAGGKRALVPDISRLLPPAFNDYWEPFLGGGAVFFSLENRIRHAHLSDLNLDLIITYRMIQKNPEPIIALLERHSESHSRSHYHAVREEHEEQDPVVLAARFVYLNKTCYNGLYRVNKSGKFNVPMGSYETPLICDAENLRAAARVLQKATLRTGSFDDSRIAPQRGDVVYCDPPYDGTFAAYTDGGFGSEEQESLRDRATEWADAGAHVVLSNSDTPLIRSLYGGWTLVEVQAARNINSNGAGRSKVGELLIVNA